MTVILAPCSESILTARYQTTVPEPVRKVLSLNKRDQICYTIQSDGQFLDFPARDIEKNPQHLQAISSDLVSHVQSLVAEVDFDLDAPSDEDK